MDPRGYVFEGRADTGAAAVTRTQDRTRELRNQFRMDAIRLERAKERLGNQTLNMMNSVKTPYWDTPTQKILLDKRQKFVDRGMELYLEGKNPKQDQEFIKMKQEMEDAALMQEEQKKNYASIVAVLRSDFKKGDKAVFDYDKSLEALDKGYVQVENLEDRMGVDPMEFLIPKPVDPWSLLDEMKAISVSNKSADPYLSTTYKGPDHSNHVKQAKSLLTIPANKAKYAQGVKDGLWTDEDDYAEQMAGKLDLQVAKSYGRTQKNPKSAEFNFFSSNGAFNEKEFNAQASKDQWVNLGEAGEGTGTFSPRGLSLTGLKITVAYGDAYNPKTMTKIDKVGNAEVEGGNVMIVPVRKGTDQVFVGAKSMGVVQGKALIEEKIKRGELEYKAMYYGSAGDGEQILVDANIIDNPQALNRVRAVQYMAEQKNAEAMNVPPPAEKVKIGNPDNLPD